MDHHLIQHPTYFSGGTSTGKTPFQKLFIASGWGFLIRYYYLTDITIIINPISATSKIKYRKNRFVFSGKRLSSIVHAPSHIANA